MDAYWNGDYPTNIVALLLNANRKGIRLWVEQDQLKFKGPANALTPGEIESLRKSRGSIVSYLKSTRAGPSHTQNTAVQRAPLTYSQLQHWHFYNLAERPGLRHLASVTYLWRSLRIDVLRWAVMEVIARHDALRTRIVLENGSLQQVVSLPATTGLIVEDAYTTAESRREAVSLQRVADMVLKPVSVTVDPLFEVRLLRFSDREHALLLVMEHIISDMWSLALLERDILTTYTYRVKGCQPPLADIPIQFTDYAYWQLNEQPYWEQKHGGYWRERLDGAQRLSFPSDQGAAVSGSGWKIVPVQISKDLQARVQLWSRAHQTTAVMTFLTAYVALVLRWCNVQDTVIRCESNGRPTPKLENTIGYFTAPLFLRLTLGPESTLRELLGKTIREYCAASEHADASFIESRSPRPAFTHNTAFNWVSPASKAERPPLEDTQESLRWSSIPFDNPRLANLTRDTEPFMVCFEAPHGLSCGVWFPLERFSVGGMESFARHYVLFVERLLSDPSTRIGDLVVHR